MNLLKRLFVSVVFAGTVTVLCSGAVALAYWALQTGISQRVSVGIPIICFVVLFLIVFLTAPEDDT